MGSFLNFLDLGGPGGGCGLDVIFWGVQLSVLLLIILPLWCCGAKNKTGMCPSEATMLTGVSRAVVYRPGPLKKQGDA